MSDFYIKQGDTLEPILTRLLDANGVPITRSLVGAVVEFHMATIGGTLLIPAGTGFVAADEATIASATTDLGVLNADLVFTSAEEGATQNAITVEYDDPRAASQPLSVDVLATTIDNVSVQAIRVHLATSGGGAITSTATQVMNAIKASPAAHALVDVAMVSGVDGSGVVTEMDPIELLGGFDSKTVGYGWSVGDTATISPPSQPHQAEMQITYAAGGIETFPNTENINVHIFPQVA